MVPSPPTTAFPLHYCSQSEQRSRWLSQLAELIAFPTILSLPQHHRDLILAEYAA